MCLRWGRQSQYADHISTKSLNRLIAYTQLVCCIQYAAIIGLADHSCQAAFFNSRTFGEPVGKHLYIKEIFNPGSGLYPEARTDDQCSSLGSGYTPPSLSSARGSAAGCLGHKMRSMAGARSIKAKPGSNLMRTTVRLRHLIDRWRRR